MRHYTNIFLVLACCVAPLIFSGATLADTEKAGKTYTEQKFLKEFSGKTRKQVAEKLGQPGKKAQSVKPVGGDAMLTSVAQGEKKSVNVEMWYYAHLVTYDGKRTYKSTELTFVNDRVQNIGFFNVN